MAGKSCSMSNFNVDASPTLVPRAEKSTVRADMNKSLETMRARRANAVLRRESGSAVTEAERNMYGSVGGVGGAAQKALRRSSGAAVTKGEKRFNAAMQHPALKNLGL